MTLDLWESYDAEPDFWIAMAQRMDEAADRWWTQPDLAVLQRACAGSPLTTLAALWHRAIEDVCTGL